MKFDSSEKIKSSGGGEDVGESRNNVESEPAAQVNESREAGHDKGEHFSLQRHRDSVHINQTWKQARSKASLCQRIKEKKNT